MRENKSTKKNGTNVVSYTAAFAGMWSSAARTMGILEQEYRANPSMAAMNISTSGQAAGITGLGLGAALSCFSYYQLSQKEELSDHEALVKKTLLADIATQVSTSSALLISIVGPKAAQTLLASSETLTGAGASVLGNIFLASGFISIGLNLVRTFSANKALAKLKNQRDQDLDKWLPKNNDIKKLSEIEKETLFKAVLTDDMSTLKNANLLALADKLKKSIAQDPSRKEMLYQHFSKVLDQRFVRNSSVQSFLYSAISVAIVLTMIAFPPSMVIFASVAFLSIVLKFGWDMYRMHQKNKTQEELEEKIFPTKVEIKSSTTQPQDAAIKQPTPTIAAPEDTKSAFISHKEKFKEILSTDQSVITPSKR